MRDQEKAKVAAVLATKKTKRQKRFLSMAMRMRGRNPPVLFVLLSFSLSFCPSFSSSSSSDFPSPDFEFLQPHTDLDHIPILSPDPCSLPSSSSLPRVLYPHSYLLSSLPPPPLPPSPLLPYYTRCNSIPVASFYVDDSNNGIGTHYQFNEIEINNMIDYAKVAKEKKWKRHSRHRLWFEALEQVKIKDKRVMVIGSQEPIVESIVLSFYPSHISVLEYNTLTYSHPNITTYTPITLSFLPSAQQRFDVVIAFSCLDHDGLGRYGDPLAPDGDLKMMDKIRTKYLVEKDEKKGEEGGVLMMSVPIGTDLVVWNLQRRYGRIRLPLLLEGWEKVVEPVGWEEGKLDEDMEFRQRYEPVFILRPKRARTDGDSQPASIPTSTTELDNSVSSVASNHDRSVGDNVGDNSENSNPPAPPNHSEL